MGYQPTSSDTVARLAGTNLTAMANQFGLTGLLYDSGGNARGATGNWTIGITNAATGGASPPVFTVQPSNQQNVTNTTLTFTWTTTGDSSPTYYAIFQTNGYVQLSPWSTTASWPTNSPIVTSNNVWVVATNDYSTVTSSAAFYSFTNGAPPVIPNRQGVLGIWKYR